MKTNSILILLIGGIVLTAGDLLLKEWVSTHKVLFYILGLFVWFIGLLFLAESFKYTNIAVASLVFTIFNIIILTVVSWIVFKEQLSTIQLLGLFLGLVAIGILERG